MTGRRLYVFDWADRSLNAMLKAEFGIVKHKPFPAVPGEPE
jgi:hypothetical protein